MAMSVGETYKINSGDFLRSEYSIAHQQRRFLLIRSSDQLEVYPAGTKGPILLGRVTFGSPRSGAIWKSGDCIGEYLINESGKFEIIPINGNRKEALIIRNIDPVRYLLESLTEEA